VVSVGTPTGTLTGTPHPHRLPSGSRHRRLFEPPGRLRALERRLVPWLTLRACRVLHSELDAGVLSFLFGRTPAANSKRKSTRLKYILFATEAAAWPLLPVKPANLLRYALWLPRNGIRSGWKGAMVYITSLCNWQKELGYDDPRNEISFYWASFRRNFNRLIVTNRRYLKLPLRPAMLEAMAMDADWQNDDDLRDICAYYLLFFAGFRIGTVTASVHALKFEDIYFFPTLAQCTTVLICVRSTKTRPRAAGLPFWTAVSRQPTLPFCPVGLLQAHFLRAFRRRPGDNLFTTTAGRPWPRTTFNAILRRRLDFAQRHLAVRIDITKFSAISFRKGCLSTLGALGVPAHRLADHADHADVASSRAYTVDTIFDRAANSDLIASSFLGGSRS